MSSIRGIDQGFKSLLAEGEHAIHTEKPIYYENWILSSQQMGSICGLFLCCWMNFLFFVLFFVFVFFFVFCFLFVLFFDFLIPFLSFSFFLFFFLFSVTNYRVLFVASMGSDQFIHEVYCSIPHTAIEKISKKKLKVTPPPLSHTLPFLLSLTPPPPSLPTPLLPPPPFFFSSSKLIIECKDVRTVAFKFGSTQAMDDFRQKFEFFSSVKKERSFAWFNKDPHALKPKVPFFLFSFFFLSFSLFSPFLPFSLSHSSFFPSSPLSFFSPSPKRSKHSTPTVNAIDSRNFSLLFGNIGSFPPLYLLLSQSNP